MEMIDRLRAWTYARQGLAEPARTPLQALDAIVGVYATHPTAPLALWARCRTFTSAAYRRLDRDGRALRYPCMRQTVFLVSRKKAAKVFTAVRPSAAYALRALKWQKISPQTYKRLAGRVLRAARQPLSTAELGAEVGIEGDKLTAVVRSLRYEGRLVNIAGDSLLSSPHKYVATETLEPDGLDEGDHDEALAWLAGEYLHAYGPARAEDFAWWTGVTKTKAANAIATVKTVNVDETLLLLDRDKAKFERTKLLSNTIALLPKWDSYTMGHAPDGRQRFVHPAVQEHVYTPIGPGLPGDGNPVVLIDGEASATWTYSKKEGPAVQPFDSVGPKIRKRIDQRLDDIVALLSS